MLTDEQFELLENPEWRVRNLYSIVDKESKLIPFSPNYVQDLVNKDRQLRQLILKFRQVGMTTNEIVHMFDFARWNKNVNAGILAHDRESLEKIFRMVWTLYSNMPDELKPTLDKGGGSKYAMRFPEQNSTIFATLKLRGGTTHWLHISEAAFKEEKDIKATLESVPLHGRVTMETTPNGFNHYRKRWKRKNSTYKKFFFPWFIFNQYAIPTDRTLEQLKVTQDEWDFIKKAKLSHNVEITPSQLLFRRTKVEDLGELYFQEYPEDDESCFLASGGNPFDLMKLKRVEEKCTDPIFDNGWLKVWKEKDKLKTCCGS